MDPDKLKQAWQAEASQTRITMNADQLLDELRRKEQSFKTTIFWRDVREIGTSLLMAPLWIYLGMKQSLPWTWYLAVPAMLWIAGFMAADRMRHRRNPPEPGEPLRHCAERSLEEVKHQIWLLRNILWWYLLPLVVAMLGFFGQLAWQLRSGGWWTAVGISLALGISGVVLASLYWLNQVAVRADLEPRRQKLEAVVMDLRDEATDAS